MTLVPALPISPTCSTTLASWKERFFSAPIDHRGCIAKLIRLPSVKRGGMIMPLRSSRSRLPAIADRKSVVSGKSVSVRVELGGRRIIQQQKPMHHQTNQNHDSTNKTHNINTNEK